MDMPVVYCYHCITSGKKYVGVTNNEMRRKSQHESNIRLGRYPDLAFYRAARKYGWDSFIYGVIEYCPEEQLDEREEYWISELNTMKEGYNMREGGKRSTLTEEQKQKISNTLKGRTISKEHREIISKRHKGKKLTEEHKERVTRGMEKKYEIEYTSGEIEIVKGIKAYCKERGYIRSCIIRMLAGKQSKHKDIARVTKLG